MEKGLKKLENMIDALNGAMGLRFDKIESRLDTIEKTLDTVEKNTNSTERRTTKNEDDIRQIKNKIQLA
jgi:hypothetical protein